jgi:hypothetical protein
MELLWARRYALPQSRRARAEINIDVQTSRHFRPRLTIASSFLPGLQVGCLMALATASLISAGPAGRIAGRVTDPQGAAVGKARIKVTGQSSAAVCQTTSDEQGYFICPLVEAGEFSVTAASPAFRPVAIPVRVEAGARLEADLQFRELVPEKQVITVSADVTQLDVQSPDPAEKVFASEDLMDANPGRPGAPISIPGYPIETASSGIKAPQYFAPGVAGDHGEPIAQFIQVGSYLVPNNLSANAHGNGYADPNMYVADVIESVEVDGGAFNVREGNHALNLGTTYALRSHVDPFFTLAGDQRDITGTAGLSPSPYSWIAMEFSYGNGFLDRREHRKQLKINGGRVFNLGGHTLTLFGIGYYGFSYVAGLRPMYGFNSADVADGWTEHPDTIDPRQKDQTHTALVALNDVWRLSDNQELQLSGFFRTYNLSLFSDFGVGLIRQSEFRTVTGGSAAYRRKFSKNLTLLAGTDYEREAPRRDDLDHYNFYNPANPAYYGPFIKVDGNNVTIAPVTPYVAGEGELSKYFRYYLGWRRDEISIDNQDLVTPANSWNKLVGLNSPKATITFFPEESWYVPQVAFSYGKSFFTEDPRTGSATGQDTATGAPAAVDPVETAESYQLVASKTFHKTDLKLTLGHETQTAEYGKIDPDDGLQFDLGPGRIRYIAVTLRQSFRYGALQATLEQADARDLDTGLITPEAPRLIGDLSWTYQKLPLHLQAKGEFEYVGKKVVGNGCDENNPNDLSSYCIGVPNQEFRLALARPFLEGKINVGLNMMIATGFTGQTTENFATNRQPGFVGPLPVPENPIAEVVGVHIPSYASVNFTYRFGH